MASLFFELINKPALRRGYNRAPEINLTSTIRRGSVIPSNKTVLQLSDCFVFYSSI